MNKKLLFATLISLSNQAFAGSFAGSFGLGATAQKTTLEIEKNGNASEFEKDGNKGYFAGKALVSLGMKKGSSFFGVKLSASLMSDKKNLEVKIDGKDVETMNSKSNFAVHVGPEFGYQVNDKFSVHSAILLAYKHIEINQNALTIENVKVSAAKAEKECQYGFGATVAAFYSITKMFQVGLEGGADYMMKKENSFKTKVDDKDKEVKFDVKSNFAPHASVIAKISFGK
ncbi:hypothetical protein FZC35_01700 [Candidatus Cytomitobacter indipagum]|uniref:Outer membrane protein beta-barrel domain-containing protein n=1 Tax=Candidatus Cytomitobacter indipagum TaxID=2601575 RepID=A0A5C0UGC4_9PROT|nr:hypothetical protein [Candidatus Cytomitobacter indipagum]QEK38084.1 hypothetical protein FZC35_01700 [Candidatus Cytomitobacter indipagum]